MLAGHANAVLSVAFPPYGDTLASGTPTPRRSSTWSPRTPLTVVHALDRHGLGFIFASDVQLRYARIYDGFTPYHASCMLWMAIGHYVGEQTYGCR